VFLSGKDSHNLFSLNHEIPKPAHVTHPPTAGKGGGFCVFHGRNLSLRTVASQGHTARHGARTNGRLPDPDSTRPHSLPVPRDILRQLASCLIDKELVLRGDTVTHGGNTIFRVFRD
jgi:hypothetical protein